MEFLTITQAERDALIADTVISRERELLSYETNLAHYRSILATLPADDWPEAIAQYSGANVHKLAAVLDDTTMEQVARYALRDNIRTVIRTEKIEMQKSLALYTAARGSLPTDSKTVLESAKTRLAASR